MSIQDGIRISESIELSIRSGMISGLGHDKDGDFELIGDYDDRTNQVRITRRYTWTSEPSQESAGIPYDYDGHWDGSLVSGIWRCRYAYEMNGPFEMWPAGESDMQELSIELEQFRELTTIR